MTEGEDMAARTEEVRRLLREVHGVRGRTLREALARARLVLPRRIRQLGLRLAEAEPLLGHPKLERMVDVAALRAAHEEVVRHLKSVDRAYLRRGRLLGMAGAMAVNVMVVAVLFLIWARWQGQP